MSTLNSARQPPSTTPTHKLTILAREEKQSRQQDRRHINYFKAGVCIQRSWTNAPQWFSKREWRAGFKCLKKHIDKTICKWICPQKNKMVWRKFKAMFFPQVHLADSNRRRKEAISTQNQSNKAKKKRNCCHKTQFVPPCFPRSTGFLSVRRPRRRARSTQTKTARKLKLRADITPSTKTNASLKNKPNAF